MDILKIFVHIITNYKKTEIKQNKEKQKENIKEKIRARAQDQWQDLCSGFSYLKIPHFPESYMGRNFNEIVEYAGWAYVNDNKFVEFLSCTVQKKG